MKPNQHLGLALASLIALGAASPACAGLFTGDFAPVNWQIDGPDQQNSINPGTFGFSGAGNSILTITGAHNTDSFSWTVISLKPSYANSDSVLNFTWSLAQEGNNGAPRGGYWIGTDYSSDYHEFPQGLSGTVSGVTLPAHTYIAFELDSDLETTAKPSATLTITAVPEAGTWLAGVFALGVVALEVVRRKRRVPVAPALT